MNRHLPFQAYLIWSAILLGLFAGFGLGAQLIYSIAFGTTPAKAFTGMIQVHGHLQLIGWTGLFIIGVSLFKLPRLMSSKPFSKDIVRLLCGSLILGLVLKSLSQILIFYTTQNTTLRTLVTVGSLLESFAIILYFSILIKNSISFRSQAGAYAAASIKPFLVVSLFGWLLYALINAAIGIDFYLNSLNTLSATWNNLATETYIHGVLLPTCFAFSISTFPIFLRLRAPTWAVSRLAIFYAAGVVVYLAGVTAAILWPSIISNLLQVIGVAIRVAAIIFLLVEMDLLRIHRPWFLKYRDNQDRQHRPPRRFAGDYGQFGNFELLIYAAYGWLLIGSSLELAAVFSLLSLSSSVIRHFYLLGFVTHLILGMAVRIIPGFLGKNRIAYPQLVRLSLLLILSATIARTLPVLFSLLDSAVIRAFYGFSGVIAMLAIASLGINLFATVQQIKRQKLSKESPS